MLGKRASPVRREAVRKGPLWYLAGGPPYGKSGSARGPPEKDPPSGHLVGGLPEQAAKLPTDGRRESAP
jgi:hypothetical protein